MISTPSAPNGPGHQLAGSRPEWLEAVSKLAQEACVKANCYLYDVEFIGSGKGRTLRIFIDNEAGVGLDECTSVANGLNEILDANEELVPGGTYDLEVSSPGLERSLRQPWHFEKAVGKKIFVKTEKALSAWGVESKKWQNAKTVEAVLKQVQDEILYFEVKDDELKIPLAAVSKAKMIFEMGKVKKI